MKRAESTLYRQLMKLCEENTNFFYKDHISINGTKFRIFNYIIANYTDWLKPGALECRGIMFLMEDDKPVKIASRPMQKFFNYKENPFTMELDVSSIRLEMSKLDGSLISSYLDSGRVYLKSKGSLSSDQAFTATSMLYTPHYTDLLEVITELTEQDYTVNMEYTSPYNRIVVGYDNARLTVLNVRHNTTGEYIPYSELYANAVIRKYLVQGEAILANSDDMQKYISDLTKQEGIEGSVFVTEDGLWFKLKTDWYKRLHFTKDSVNNNRRLFEVISNNEGDDLRAMFADDPVAIEKIQAFEDVYIRALELRYYTVTGVNQQLQGLDRKAYAQNAQVLLNQQGLPQLFPIVMRMYIGMDTDDIIENIRTNFMKECDYYVPEVYK